MTMTTTTETVIHARRRRRDASSTRRQGRRIYLLLFKITCALALKSRSPGLSARRDPSDARWARGSEPRGGSPGGGARKMRRWRRSRAGKPSYSAGVASAFVS
eukprot:9262247-Pyramimonas_sp.AAC.1